MSELQDALDRMSKSGGIALLIKPDHDAVKTVMDAARLVANPNIEAAAEAVLDTRDLLSWEAAKLIVAAALTPPGDTQ